MTECVVCGVVAWRNGSSREAGIGTPVGRFFILANNTLSVNAVRPVLAPIGVAEADAPHSVGAGAWKMLQQSTCSTVLGGAECASSCGSAVERGGCSRESAALASRR